MAMSDVRPRRRNDGSGGKPARGARVPSVRAPATVLKHLYHRHGAVWCGYSCNTVQTTRDSTVATCGDCVEIAKRFAGANPACGCRECRRG